MKKIKGIPFDVKTMEDLEIGICYILKKSKPKKSQRKVKRAK
jgi:hypothetical protein